MILVKQSEKISLRTLAKKHLPLSWYDVLLHVIGNPLVDRKILGIRWHLDFHLRCQREKIIYRIARIKNDGRKIQKVDFLLANVTRCHRLNVNKRPKINFQLVLLHEVFIHIFPRLRLWLSNQYALDFEFAFC